MRKKVLQLTPEQQAFFSAASARRRRVDTACEVCGKELPGVLATRRYCSPACAKRAQRQRARQAEGGEESHS